MVLVSSAEQPLFYREESETVRTARFCLMPVKTVQPRAEKRTDVVNVQVVKGKTTTFIQLDEDEAKKVQQHGDAVLRRLQRVHRGAVWNVLLGRSFVDRVQRAKGAAAAEESNLDRDYDGSEFDAANPRSWSADSLAFVHSLLKATDFRFDGFVVLFCVESDARDASAVDYDELAWELEKCLVYHLVATRPQLVMNEEGTMSRRGLDPVSRKTKTPGRNRAGYLVYMAYQLLDSVTQDQIVGEALHRCIDIPQKRRHLLTSLSESKLPPQLDEKVRKQIKELKEFLTRDQLNVVDKLRDVKDAEQLDMLAQFINILKGGKERSASMMQFLSFLNMGGGEDAGGGGGSTLPRRASQVDGGRSKTSSSTLPRPTSAALRPGNRKSSNATFSVSSGGSTTPDTPRRNSRLTQRRESGLASIPSNESLSRSSTPETLRKEEQRSRPANGQKRKSAVPQPTGKKAGGSGATTAGGRRPTPGRAAPSSAPSNGRAPRAQARTDSGSRSGTPRAGSARSSVNGDAYSPRLTPSSPLTGSPRMTSSATRRGGRPPPDPDRMITREDLRRMNRSYPSASPGASPRGTKASGSAGKKSSSPATFTRAGF